MEKLKISNQEDDRSNKYSWPTNCRNDGEKEDNDAIEDEMQDNESNKSTPYYTPMDFLHTSFEFPPPKLEECVNQSENDLVTTPPGLSEGNVRSGITEIPQRVITPRLQLQMGHPKSGQFLNNLSPTIGNKKIRRFSLYERRSCSPQHLLMKSVSPSVDINIDQSIVIVDNKENTKPTDTKEDSFNCSTNIIDCDNNTPVTIIDEIGSSPKVLSTNETNRLAYSPKLLTSINNMNLNSSPLGVISSAGYKNGSYFKFPEIDHHIIQGSSQFLNDFDLQQNEEIKTNDDQVRKEIKIGSNSKICLISSSSPVSSKSNYNPSPTSADTEPNVFNPKELKCDDSRFKGFIPKSIAPDCRKNRKNKNNLTIRITNEMPCGLYQQFSPSPSPSPSPKPKTPTIKSTKEKALSLDSAGTGESLSGLASGAKRCMESHASCNELGISNVSISIAKSLHERNANINPERLQLQPALISLHSSSLSLLSVCSPEKQCKSLNSINRSIRRRGGANSLINNKKIVSTEGEYNEGDLILNENDEIPSNKRNFNEHETMLSTKHIQSGLTLLTPHRGLHKPNPLLHASNTNLKTLPEFLTLVEFNTNSPKEAIDAFPQKQKSMEIPNSTCSTSTSNTFMIRPKNVAPSSSSTNLLQRRGSNHSLTLNLHGSCSNLLGNCRSGLSISNYSLGSVANSTTNLNYKSTCNLDHSTQNSSQVNTTESGVASNQCTKQSLFRRRGSNHSLTLSTTLAATSCGNLNSFASQNSLNISQCGSARRSSGVTRTTSFITSTNNTSSHTVSKLGLLERRGSNQSLTLNMGCPTGTGAESNVPTLSNNMSDISLSYAETSGENIIVAPRNISEMSTNPCCSQAHYHRKFFSSESLNKEMSAPSGKGVCSQANMQFRSQNFQESSVCTCNGMRNIVTRPLSPQTTSEEFKIYLANIQMLQNASNALNQEDLIKLNFIFDNSYTSNGAIHQPISMINSNINRHDKNLLQGFLANNSEDSEISARYQEAVQSVLISVLDTLNDDEQKRMFRDLHKEFWDLPLNHQEKPMVFGSQAKNRYKTILPNENSRVILENESQQLIEFYAHRNEENDFSEFVIKSGLDLSSAHDEVPYINANYIKGPDYTSKCYIATQGPLPNTIFDFWLLVYQNNWQHHFRKSKESVNSPLGIKIGGPLTQYFQKIVMLTNFLENNRQKCSVYFPIELHEVFVAAAKQVIVTPTEEFLQIFEPYLLPTENNETSNTGIDEFKTDAGDEICLHLPPMSTNFFIIKNVGIVRKNGFSIRKFVLLYCAQVQGAISSRRRLLMHRMYCYHYWYPDWPDHRSPRDINTLVDICLHILNLGKCESEFETFNDQVPIPSLQDIETAQHVDLYQQDIFNVVQPLPIIHCSAGIGRTGCLTAILNGVRQLRQSLAYSLTSMAAAASKNDSSNSQAVSAVDFCLPKQFLMSIQQKHGNDNCNRFQTTYFSDTDSSYTHNTLLYIKYIICKHSKETVLNVKPENLTTQLCFPTLLQLPKIPDIFVDILGIVCNLRLQRGGMVQNSEQYELIHRTICLYLKRTFALKRF